MSQRHAMDRSLAPTGLLGLMLLLFTATLVVGLSSCVPKDELTDPCEEDCNEDALVGDPCGAAEDCATGSYCNTGFPGGYCQHACTSESIGETCGPNNAGVCIEVPENDEGAACVAACDPSSPDTCGRPETACYPIEDGSIGMCNARCVTDGDCAGGMACDGEGLCRTPVSVCDGMTSQGCPTGQYCYLSNSVGAFCGSPGSGRIGDACVNVAGCVAGSWCVGGACQPLCDVDDFSACGGVPGLCTNIARGSRLGVCTR